MTSTSRDFQNLAVWQKSRQLTLAVYGATAEFPKDERYGLTSQMRRCAASVPANIAEGCGRGGTGEMARFLSIAQGSASELAYYFILARDLELLDADRVSALSEQAREVGRMLNGYIAKLQADD